MPPIDPRTLKFLVFTAFSVAALLAGYVSRRRGWVHEETARPIHFHTVLWLWSLGGIIAFWLLPLDPKLLWFLVIIPITIAVPTYMMIPLANWAGATRPQIGVLAIGAGIANCGMTLGSYLCYCILGPEHAASLALATAFASIQLVIAVPLIYPVAQHFSTDEADRLPVGKLIFTSIFNTRSIGLFAGLIGLALAIAGVPFPQWIHDAHVLDIVIYLCAAGGYFGIGLRLRPGDSLHHKPLHALLAVMKFIVIPLVSYAMLRLIGAAEAPLPGTLARVVMVQAFIPAGTSIVILANLFHLDARLASVLWVWNTFFFLVLPLPVIIWWFH